MPTIITVPCRASEPDAVVDAAHAAFLDGAAGKGWYTFRAPMSQSTKRPYPVAVPKARVDAAMRKETKASTWKRK